MIPKKHILIIMMLLATFIFACSPALHEFSEIDEDVVIDDELYDEIYEELENLNFDVTYSKVGEGTIYPEGKRPFDINELTNMRAEPAQGWHFVGWFLYVEQQIIDVSEEIEYIISEEGTQALLNNEYDHLLFLIDNMELLEHIQINPDETPDIQIVALFLEFEVPEADFNVTYTKIGEGTIYPEGTRPFDPKDLLELEAQPTNGWTFVGWFLHLEPRNSGVIVIDNLEEIIQEDFEGLVQGDYENTYFFNDEFKILEYSNFFFDEEHDIYLIAYFIETNNVLPNIYPVEFIVIDETQAYEILTIKMPEEGSVPMIKSSNTNWHLIRLLQPGTYNWELSGRKKIFSDDEATIIKDDFTVTIDEEGTITGDTSYIIEKTNTTIFENLLVEVIKRGEGNITPAEGTEEYNPNHNLYLNAEPARGWTFYGWFIFDMDDLDEEVYSTTNNSFYLTVNKDFIAIAEFIEETEETTTTSSRRSRRSTPYTYNFSYTIPGEGERAPLIEITFPEPPKTTPEIEEEPEPETLPEPEPVPEPEIQEEAEEAEETSFNSLWIIAIVFVVVAIGLGIFLYVKKV